MHNIFNVKKCDAWVKIERISSFNFTFLFIVYFRDKMSQTALTDFFSVRKKIPDQHAAKRRKIIQEDAGKNEVNNKYEITLLGTFLDMTI